MAKSSNPWTRWAFRLGVTLLTLAFLLACFVVYVRHSQAQRLQRALVLAESLKTAPSEQTTASASQTPAVPVTDTRVPMQDLPYLGRFVSTDPAVKAAAEAENKAISQFISDVREVRDKKGGLRALLEKLGIPSDPDMTDQQIYAALATYTREKFRDILQLIQADIRMGPWRLPPVEGVNSWPNTEHMHSSFKSLVLSSLLAEFELKAGSASAQESLQMMDGLLKNVDGSTSFMGALIQNSMLGQRHRLLSGPAALAGLTDDQLKASRTQPTISSLEIAKQGLAAERRWIQSLLDDPQKMEELKRLTSPGPTNFPDSLFNTLILPNYNTTRLQLSLADIVIAESRFSPEGIYHPLPSDTRLPSEEYQDEAAWIASLLTLPKLDFMDTAASPEHKYTSSVRSIAGSGARNQTQGSLADISIVLEMERRRSGSYPPDLNAVSNYFQDGLPTDTYGGQPLNYERTPDGYKVWANGEDGVNNGGDKTKDIILAR